MAKKVSKTTEEVEIKIFENKLVPKARILSEDEVKELLKKYNIKLRELPKILITDPVVRALKAETGQVIEFSRSEELYGYSKYYRLVIGGV